MNARFPLGTVVIKEDAAAALLESGQDADFFVDKHAAGDWGEEDPVRNELALREGHILVSRYHTLRGQEIYVITFSDRQKTCIFCPPRYRFEYSYTYNEFLSPKDWLAGG